MPPSRRAAPGERPSSRSRSRPRPRRGPSPAARRDSRASRARARRRRAAAVAPAAATAVLVAVDRPQRLDRLERHQELRRGQARRVGRAQRHRARAAVAVGAAVEDLAEVGARLAERLPLDRVAQHEEDVRRRRRARQREAKALPHVGALVQRQRICPVDPRRKDGVGERALRRLAERRVGAPLEARRLDHHLDLRRHVRVAHVRPFERHLLHAKDDRRVGPPRRFAAARAPAAAAATALFALPAALGASAAARRVAIVGVVSIPTAALLLPTAAAAAAAALVIIRDAAQAVDGAARVDGDRAERARVRFDVEEVERRRRRRRVAPRPEQRRQPQRRLAQHLVAVGVEGDEVQVGARLGRAGGEALAEGGPCGAVVLEPDLVARVKVQPRLQLPAHAPRARLQVALGRVLVDPGRRLDAHRDGARPALAHDLGAQRELVDA